MELVKQVFDKKSPLFMISITVFIIAIIAKSQPQSSTCTLSHQISQFQIFLIIILGVQIFLKTIAMQIFNKCCTSSITLINFSVIILFILVNLGFFGWSLYLNIELRKQPQCVQNEPHTFFLQVYSVLFAFINVVLLTTLASLKMQNQTMTVLDKNTDIYDHQL